MWIKGSCCRSPSIVLLVAVVSHSTATAQHVLRGLVVDSVGSGLPGVEVVLAEAERRSVTDSNGRYIVFNIPTGRYEVVFRRLGYEPAVIFRSFQGDTGTTEVDVRLSVEAVMLPDLETKATGPEAVPLKLQGWAWRREHNGGGKFWDDSLLRTKEYQRVPELLQGISGVRIVRANGKRFLATSGGRAGVTFQSLRGLIGDPRGVLLPSVPKGCYATVFLDGIRLAFNGEPPNLDDLSVQQIAAMEFYRSTSEMPAEFNSPGSLCGVLAIWTRVGGGR